MSKYSQYVVQELKAPFTPEQAEAYKKFARRILWIDDKVVPGAFQMNCSWYLKPLGGPGVTPHTHPEDEIIGFFGHDPDDPYNLHGEVEMWLGDQKFIINKTAMVFIPGGLKHCPLILKKCDEPIFHFSVITGGRWSMDKLQETRKATANYSQNVVTELKAPKFPASFIAEYKTFATRVLWMDKNVVPGAFQMNVSWYCHPKNHAPVAHKHDVGELIGFFGGNPDDRYNLNGEVEIWIEDEQFLLTKSTLLYIPPNMNHCPLIIRRADRPIFHFSVVTGGMYEQTK
jgi:mannose-6-phosphate isomerase-like protein (cupin superfamily)